MEVTREVVRNALIESIKETNRCMYLNHANASSKTSLIEIRGLLKSWICKLLRKYISYGDTNIITKDENLSITCEGDPAQISNISLYLDKWDVKDGWAPFIQSELRRIYYPSLKYKRPIITDHSQFSRQDPIIQDIQKMTFDSINNIKF